MDMETLRCMMINLRECSEGANEPCVPTMRERYDHGEFDVACDGGCGRKVRPDSEGLCYECMAGMHTCGAFDMDSP